MMFLWALYSTGFILLAVILWSIFLIQQHEQMFHGLSDDDLTRMDWLFCAFLTCLLWPLALSFYWLCKKNKG